MNTPYLSIVTPTYNRGHLLCNCYASLLRQTDKDFEWIIIDDGSQDDTASVVERFAVTEFPITYVKKENGGKHTALNSSHPYIHGKYVLILDSDDTLTDDAVAAVREAWARYEANTEVGILTFLKGETVDTPICTVEDFDVPVDIMRYQRKWIYGSDCCEVIRSELFIKYPFPVFVGERFISECALWNRVSFTHKCVYINKVIYLFEFLEGGLTKSGKKLRIQNPRGGMFITNIRMHPKNYAKQRMKYALLYCCYGFFAGYSPREILGMTEKKALAILCLLPGYMIYIIWKKKYL